MIISEGRGGTADMEQRFWHGEQKINIEKLLSHLQQ